MLIAGQQNLIGQTIRERLFVVITLQALRAWPCALLAILQIRVGGSDLRFSLADLGFHGEPGVLEAAIDVFLCRQIILDPRNPGVSQQSPDLPLVVLNLGVLRPESLTELIRAQLRVMLIVG